MRQHSLETIYCKMGITGARIIASEWEIVIKDLVKRITKLEEASNDNAKPVVEKPTAVRSGARKVSKKKVSSS
jgi:hypothetical protein